MANDLPGYIVDAANSRGIDPSVALRVFQSEGASAYTGDSGSSFGPFQLHMGGIASGGNAVSGMGDDFLRDTGLDPRDPSTTRPQVDYALDQAAKSGWGAFHGAKTAGIGEFQGVPKDPGAANLSLIKSYMKPPSGKPGAAAQVALDPDTAALISSYTKPLPGASGAPAGSNPPLSYTPPPGAPAGTPHLSLDAAGNTILAPPLSPAQQSAQDASGSSRVLNPADSWADLGAAARQGAGYVGGQVAGIPGAAYQQGTNALSVAGSGLHDIAGGNVPLGLLKAAGGVAGMASAPITGAVQKLVEEPATAYAGPDVGNRLGFAANMLAGPAAGKLLGGVGNVAAGATIGSLDAETAQLATLARQKYGIDVTAPQMTPSAPLKFAGSTTNRLPFSGAAADMADQQGAFNRGVAGTIGEDATKLTPDVMSRARDRIGAVFNNVAASTTIHADQPFQDGLMNVMHQAEQNGLSPDEMRPLGKIFDNIVDQSAGGTLPGTVYQTMTKNGSPLANAIDSANPNVSNFAKQLRGILDDGLERSAPPEMISDLQNARGEWRNLKTIEPIVAKADTGDVSPALLRGAVNTNTGNGMAYGRGGDLGELARIGQRFLKEPPSSGTAERLTTTNLLSAAIGGGAAVSGVHELGLAPYLMTPAGAGATIGGVAAGSVLSRALRSNALAHIMLSRSLPPVSTGLNPFLAAASGAGGIMGFGTPKNGLSQ